jgi:hypothetical protein
MSYTFLLEQGEESSAEYFSDIPAYVLSRLKLSFGSYCISDSETASCQSSRSGTTSGHSTESLGGGLPMSFAEASHVKTLPLEVQPVPESMEQEADYGKRWHGWFARFDHVTSLWRTPQCYLFEDLEPFLEIWPHWGLMLDGECFQLAPLVLHIHGKGCFSLPTPNATNGKRGGGKPERWKQRHQINLEDIVGGRVNPESTERLMGWPTSWTDLKPLETDKFQQWLNSHGKP